MVWPNAAYVLEQLGALDEVVALAGCPRRMRRLSSANEELGVIDIELINRHMGYPSLSILRTEFQRVLASKLESLGIKIHYGKMVTNLEDHRPDYVAVRFQNGSTIPVDVIVGADGCMASNARRYVHDDNTPVFQGFINWIGFCESKKKLFSEISVLDYWGVGERFGIVPITKYKAYWVACTDIGVKNPVDYKTEFNAVFFAMAAFSPNNDRTNTCLSVQ